MKVLFICTGNTCRSPMAEALLQHKSPEVKVKSAGIYANEGAEINENAQIVLQQISIITKHSSQGVTDDLLDWADIIFTMTRNHKDILISEYPNSHEKVHTLKGYVCNKLCSEGNSRNNEDIGDPFGQDVEKYRETLSELDIYITELLTKLEIGDNKNEEESSF